MTNLMNIFEIDKVLVFAEKTKNSFLKREGITSVMGILSSGNDEELQKFKKNKNFKTLNQDLKNLIGDGYLVKKEDIPSFILFSVSIIKGLDYNFGFNVYQRNDYSEYVKTIVSVALNLNFDNYFSDEVKATFGPKLMESINDLRSNANVYKNNPRFKQGDAVNLILKEIPNLSFEYNLIDLGEKYLLKTNDRNFKSNLLVN